MDQSDKVLASESNVRKRRIYSVKWSEYDPAILPAWVADSDLGIPPQVKSALLELVDLEEVGYPPFRITTDYLAAFSDWQSSRHGVEMSPSTMLALSDVIQGFTLAISTLVDKDSGVVFLTPSYPPFYSAVSESQRRTLTSELVIGPNGYELDLDDLGKKMHEAGTGGALLLCNPHNPTGRVLRAAELDQIAELVLKYGLRVISDEIHADLCYPGYKHIPFASISKEIAARTVTLSSASKSFNLAGLHCAVLHAGSPELFDALKSIPQGILGHPSSVGLIAGTVAFREASDWLNETITQLLQNRDRVMSWAKGSVGRVDLFKPEGTYLAWLDFSQADFETTAHEYLLKRAGVALNAGEAFAQSSTKFARLNFGTSTVILDELLQRISAAL